MISPSAPGYGPARIAPQDWDKLRHEFQHSMLVETSLRSLAENIDGCFWPINDLDETPARFIELTHAEALARLASQGLPASKLDVLADILRGTLAFDSSFGDMLEIASKAEADLNIVHLHLDRLGIPRDFPVRLCNFTPALHQFCVREGLTTLQDLPRFRHTATAEIIIGEEFRELINALTHVDEHTIARFLPYRVKTSGLYLIESIALIVRRLSAAEREHLARAPRSLSPELRTRLAEYEVYFADQTTRIRAAFAAGTPLDRLVAPLDDLSIEPAVAALLGLVVKPQPTVAPAAAPAAPAQKRPGLRARLHARLQKLLRP